MAVIGTPDDAIAQLERLERQSGGYGCFLQLAHEWADRRATHKSYELIARYVMPRFQGMQRPAREEPGLRDREPRRGSWPRRAARSMKEIQKHAAEQAGRRRKAPRDTEARRHRRGLGHRARRRARALGRGPPGHHPRARRHAHARVARRGVREVGPPRLAAGAPLARVPRPALRSDPRPRARPAREAPRLRRRGAAA